MQKFLLVLMMLFVVGCAGNKSVAAKPIPAITPFTAEEIGDGSPLEEVAEAPDEAVDALPDMVVAEM